MGIPLSDTEIATAASILADSLDICGIQYGIIGGSGVALLSHKYHLQTRHTTDIDVIIQPDPAKGIFADSTSQTLITKFPHHFTSVSQYGVSTPAVRLERDNNPLLVEIEMFDVEAWPNRPQYNLQNPLNTRTRLQIGGKIVYVMSAGWLLREKILSQHQRQGSRKEMSDISDVETLAKIADDQEVICETNELTEALRGLLEKRPDLAGVVKRVVKCSAVFS